MPDYINNITTGTVIRTSDGKQVAPCQSPEDPDFVQYQNWVLAGNSPEITTTPEAAKRRITKLAFRNRFSATEKGAIEIASMDNPAAPSEMRQASAMLRVYLDDIAAATMIELDREDTIAGVMALAQYGIISTERALQVLNNPIQQHELPQ